MSTTTTIRKALIAAYATSQSDVSKISVVSAPLPPPSKKQIQVRVLYAGFSGADVNMSLGRYPFQRHAPLTPGYCMVGVVVHNPSSSSRFKPGDFVTAITTYDAQAELINVSENLLVAVPSELCTSDIPLQQVAALSLDWTTAQGMVSSGAANVKPGQRVFIHGLSGSVGQALLALCRLAGATEIYGTASPRNHPTLIDEQHVTGAFDYAAKDWIAAMQNLGGVDAVFDPLGFESWDESYSILAPKGILAGYGGNQATLSGDAAGSAKSPWPHIAKLVARGLLPDMMCGKRTSFFYVKPGTKGCEADLVAVMELLKEKKIEVRIKGVWDLTTEGLREAHSSWGKMKGMGALLIRVAGGGGGDV
ncbi:zinc-binding dehydrogenase [Podospora didyma]|uniref:Zinc-binding dehydrogenase n=1 Tax=Podospora didyma TaxID=330526 RepID=A0AAE0NB88_9PEZI|nr:zinc-binding dehydrogenase [Podospora didyma]